MGMNDQPEQLKAGVDVWIWAPHHDVRPAAQHAMPGMSPPAATTPVQLCCYALTTSCFQLSLSFSANITSCVSNLTRWRIKNSVSIDAHCSIPKCHSQVSHGSYRPMVYGC